LETVPDRYSRQIRFAPFGEAGQEALRSARVAVAGCGALGTFHVASLVRAGAGHIRVIDRDYVEWNNLQRQWLFEESDAEQGLPKPVAAAQRAAAINGEVRVEPVVADLTAATCDDLLDGVQLILDGTDNFETRYLINDYAVKYGIPWVYGAAVGSYGLTMTIQPGKTACLACVYPEPPAGAQATCETAGVLNTVTSMVAAWQVSAALQLITGQPVPRLMTTMDVWTGSVRQIRQPEPAPDCAVCGQHHFQHLDGRRRAPISLCGRNAVQIHERARPIDLAELAGRLSEIAPVKFNEFALRFFPAPFEVTVFPDGRAIIKGTQDTGLARSLYARYIGA
jgi:adenylyltransferase/sulfurtransferase